VTSTNQDYDTLITELINEINAVRNKYDAFSQYTETKVADFVHTNRHLKNLLAQETQTLAQRTQELAQRTQELAQRTQDLAITNAQRAQLHAELVAVTARVDGLILQRDKARNRVKFLESSRAYRFEQKLRSIASRLLLRK
jgi:chromosome segregation ATPase